ncbi:hypothetical protein ACHAXA_007080 [Cyclostephanos tholiformis]|uniref:Ion transport domain-containing protein n=1 Tax=Cyclostephanos tholiformis TaxID=382380 RepID=A0ABD3RZ40_9STRA
MMRLRRKGANHPPLRVPTPPSLSPRDRVPLDTRMKNLKYVIFPENRWIQVWDLFMIFAIWNYAFSIPFSFGISRGYYVAVSKGYWIYRVIINTGFFVDIFLPFFRAYRDKNGRLVLNLKQIRRRYIRSGWFFLNLLSSLPGSTMGYPEAQKRLKAGETVHDEAQSLFYLDIFKILRLVRIRQMMGNSNVLNGVWERIDIDTALFIQFLLKITVTSHWIGCIWGWIAFIEARSFGDSLLDSPNWIAQWHESSYVEGGLDPIGWENAMSRYFLALFWAVQSITSIGYGNIQPVTVTEYIFANALMLVCGIFWAYIIGKLVEVVSVKGNVLMAFTTRMSEANQMIRDFADEDLPESVIGTVITNSSARVRHFITNQREKASKNWLDSSNACSFHDAYPTLRILSPELKRVCALHLAHSLLETIPYLSSKYLSPEEQAGVILQCVKMEFSSGETFVKHPDLGRGCFLYRSGDGCIATSARTWREGPVNVDGVLVDDDRFREQHTAFHFVGFTRVLFVPRSAIMAVLDNNERAWKECARWKNFMAAFILYSSSRPGETSEQIRFS